MAPSMPQVRSTTKLVTFAELDPDPHSLLDKLPQPYRRIDKLVAELIEDTLDLIENKERIAREEAARPKPTAFHPSVAYGDMGEVTCFCVSKDGRHMFVGNKEGQLLVVHLPSRSVVVRSNVHPGPVESIDAHQSKGLTVLASASKELVCVYKVGFEQSLLSLLCSGVPPSTRRNNLISKVAVTTDAKCVLVQCLDGAVALYEIPKQPEVKEGEQQAEAPKVLHKLWLPYENLSPLLGLQPGKPTVHMQYLAHVKPLEPPPPPAEPAEGADGDTKSQRSGGGGGSKAALPFQQPSVEERTEQQLHGVWVTWEGCNRLLYFELPRASGASSSSTAEGDAAAAAEAPQASVATRDWTLPLGVSCSCMMTKKYMLMVGLEDGCTVVFDTHLITQVGVLSRTSAAVSAMSYIDDEFQLALLGTAAGEMTLLDLDTLDFSRMDAKAMETSMQRLAKPLAPGPIHAILRPHSSGSLCVLLRDGNVVELYDVNTQKTLGQLQASATGEYVKDLQATALYHSGASGFLVVGTLSTDKPVPEPQPDEMGTIVEESEAGSRPPTNQGKRPPPSAKGAGAPGGVAAAEGKGEEPNPDPEREAVFAEEVVMFSVDEAYQRLHPDGEVAAMMANPMLQRMFASNPDAPEMLANVILEAFDDPEAAQTLSRTAASAVKRGKTAGKGKSASALRRAGRGGSAGSDIGSHFKEPLLKDLKKTHGDPVEGILARLRAAGEEGRDARVRNMQSKHAALASKYAAEAGIVV